MTPIIRFLSNKNAIFFILSAGAILRVFFVFVGGNIYYGKADYFIQPDSLTWFNAFINFWERGVYTINMALDSGKFFRPPGYSFLFGIFYIISFKKILLATRLLVSVQILMDIASIYLIYKISGNIVRNVTEEKKRVFSNLSGLLYALYPFAIVWSPILYAETPSIFFILLSIYFAFKPVNGKTILASGMFAGIAVLMRLQCAFCLPFISFGFLFSSVDTLRNKARLFCLFGLGVIITYGLWPARNIILQHRVVFAQDLDIGNCWSRDFVSFLDFAYAVRTDITPVYKEIILNKKVEWPAEAYIDPSDSLLLDSVVHLCRTCGTGFSIWKVAEGLQKKSVKPRESCDTLIDQIFTSLYLKQKSKNAVNYWIKVPLGNLSKCFFKTTLYGNQGNAVKIFSTILFVGRSLLILFGLWGIYYSWKKNLMNQGFLFMTFGFMISWYIFLSFFLRNIEIRFLLQCDSILLIPAAFVLTHWLLHPKFSHGFLSHEKG